MYRIWGEKIFITNGPVADFVIVLARTGPAEGKDGISAFLVETSSTGFRVEKRMDLGFLNTSPHGELVFDDCRVPEENLLGGLGEGHVRISRAVFAWERYLLLVALTTHLRVFFQYVLRNLNQGETSLTGPQRRDLALLHVRLEGLGDMGRSLACEVLKRTELDRHLHERLLFLGTSLIDCRHELETLSRTLVKPEESRLLSILQQDARLLDVNGRLTALQLERLAHRLLATPTEEHA